jgi:hypothetical protein
VWVGVGMKNKVKNLDLMGNFDRMMNTTNHKKVFKNDPKLNSILRENVKFNQTRARRFYKNAIEFLMKEQYSLNKMIALNRELIQAAVGVGFGYLPKMIVAHNLVIQFGFQSIYRELCVIGNQPFGIIKTWDSSSRNKKDAICFFHYATRGNVDELSLKWLLISPIIVDGFIYKKYVMRRLFNQRMKREHRALRNKALQLSKLGDAKVFLDEMERNYQIVMSKNK